MTKTIDEVWAAMYEDAGVPLPAHLAYLKKEAPVPGKNGRTIIVLSHNPRSKSARALVKGLKGAMYGGSGLTPTTDVLNWGSASKEFGVAAGNIKGLRVFNTPKAINVCRNKVMFFKAMSSNKDGPRIPMFTESLEDAKKFIEQGHTVLGRKATGSMGLDIVLFEDDPEKFATSDFWSVYKKKKEEFRIHFFKFGDEITVVDKQKKALRKTDPLSGKPIDPKSVNFMIRSHRNGFVFQRENITVPDDVIEQATKAFRVTGLDFGAADVIWNDYEKKAYVLEVNTAPGLEGTTLETYTKSFEKLLG